MQGPLPVLTGRRVLLREPQDDDAGCLFRYTTNPDVTRFLAFDSPRSESDTLAFIARCREYREQDREYVFVIAGLPDGKPLGVIGLRHIDPAMRTAQVGTWLAPQVWGTGANDEAKGLLLDFAFDHLRLHRVEARIAVENERSRRAFERLGASCEGVLRESFFKSGAFHDQHLYAVLEDGWRARRAADRSKRA